jgi:hypothetical protein
MSRSQPAAGPTISLFPFLAVLLCTMGALLVVLVLFSRAVKEGVAPEAADGAAGDVQELESARDQLAWRLQQLEGIRQRTLEELARARMQLAGVEESSRSLEDELAALERMATMLEAGAAGAVDEAALKELESRLASARESLDKARAEQRTKPPAYAVVPYAGVNGTHRRPLYIECAGDGVFLQPENIRLGPADFQGPPGPGNPLASALRAAREHIVGGLGGTSDPAMQPYPLLIVRPSGVTAYYAAREAIQSWGSDFGYQLVDEDWTLAFPPADPSLVQVERRAIEESRQRLAWLAEVRPQRPAKQPRQYRAAQTRGGVVSDEGPSVLGDQSRWDWANGGGGAAGAGRAGGGRAGGDDAQGDGRGTGDSAGFGDGRGNGVWGNGGRGDGDLAGARGDGAGGGMGKSVFSSGSGGDGNGTGAGTGAGGSSDASQGSAADGPGGAAEGTVAAGRGSKSGSGNGAAGGEGGSQTAAVGATEGAGGTSATGAAASGVGASDAASSGGAGAAGGASGSAASGGAGGSAGGPAMPGLVQSGGGQSGAQAAGSSASASVSLAGARGKNWASLASQERPIPLTRPIRLECSLREFRLMEDSGRRVQTRIPLDGDTALAVDPLVKALHARVDTWGIAGDRMYWKPVLVLSETADGRSRREDLERLLADSGIDVRSADGRDEIRPLPPVERSTAAARR